MAARCCRTGTPPPNELEPFRDPAYKIASQSVECHLLEQTEALELSPLGQCQLCVPGCGLSQPEGSPLLDGRGN